MAFDTHSLLAYSTVFIAPNPALSGVSLTVQSGNGSLFAVNTNCVVFPAGVQPTKANAEIVRITAISTDTFTITRTQEGSTNQPISAGWQIAAVATPKTFTDIESAIPTLPSIPFSVPNGGTGATTLTGVVIGNGASAMTTVTAPTGTIVGTTDTQTLTNKTLTSPVISTITNTGTITLPTATDTLVGRATTDTLTNKRRTRRVVTTTQSATPTINTDNTDVAVITGLAQAITSCTTNLTGTPVDGDLLEIDITDNGTARALTFGASFGATTVALPTTTVISTKLNILFKWSAADSKWLCVATA